MKRWKAKSQAGPCQPAALALLILALNDLEKKDRHKMSLAGQGAMRLWGTAEGPDLACADGGISANRCKVMTRVLPRQAGLDGNLPSP